MFLSLTCVALMFITARLTIYMVSDPLPPDTMPYLDPAINGYNPDPEEPTYL